MKNKNILEAKNKKDDEWYTRYEDVANELEHYDFSGKSVYCPCDDYRYSAFTKYFKDNFKKLGLKKLVSTCYSKNGKGIGETVDSNGSTVFTMNDDGDVFGECSTNYMEDADVIVTNPPFSLWKDFFGLIKEKEYLIMGCVLCANYKGFFEELKEGKVWRGTETKQRKYKFIRPDGTNKEINGICWWTNLKHNVPKKVLQKTLLNKCYDKIDNTDILFINKVKDIPEYDGKIAVPLSIFDWDISGYKVVDKYNPPYVNGKAKFPRIVLEKK